MRIIVWGINYAPEVTGIAPCNRQLCRYLLRRGHDVSMVTGFAYYPQWSKGATDRWVAYRTDSLEGVPLHRCWMYVPGRPRALSRILHEASFVLTSFLRLLLLRRPDLYIVISPPLPLGAAAWLLTRLKRAPFVFHVQDLQPDAALGLGMLRRGWFTRALYGLESLAYRAARRVSGISDGMIRVFQSKGVPPARIVHFPNGIELDSNRVAKGRFRPRHDLGNREFVAVYSGNMGIKQGLDVLLDAAHGLKSSPVRLVLCGAGAARAALEARVEAESLSKVMMIPLQDKDAYAEMLADADVAIITQQRGTGSFFFPSKLLSALAAGLPVITVADESSELARAVEEGGFGVNVEPGQPEGLRKAIEQLEADRDALRIHSERALLFVQRFESKRVLDSFHEALMKIAGPDDRHAQTPFHRQEPAARPTPVDP